MRGAPPLMLFRVMAGNARAWEKFRAGSLLDRGPLTLREREIVIDRTCALTGCEYEWGVHVATFAAAAHLTEEQVRATVLGGADAPCWSAAEQALIAAVDALHARATLERRRVRGAVGALRRREDLRDHPAVRLLSHGVVSGERARAAAGGERGAVSEASRYRGRPSEPGATRELTPPRRAARRGRERCRPACWPSATISTITAGFEELTLSRMISLASMPGAIVLGFFVITSSTSAVIRSGRM